LLAPWRRRQIGRHGWSLCLLGFALQSAFFGWGPRQTADVIMGAAVVAAVGGIARVRWAPVLAIVAGGGLFLGALDSWFSFRAYDFGHYGYVGLRCLSPAACKVVHGGYLALIFAAPMAAFAAAILGWRRSPVATRPTEVRADDLPDLRRRWAVVFASAMLCVVAMYWAAGSVGALRYLGMPLVGISLCAGIGVWCAMSNVQRRWPAIVAMVAASFVALDFVHKLAHLPYWLERTGAPGALFLVGMPAMLASTIYATFRKLPEPAPIPHAKTA
jgi:hypothetical protein